MTAKELAEMLSGRDYGYGSVINEYVERQAADAGLVVVYGYSDDNVEFCGAIHEEIGAYEGTRIYVNEGGILQDPDCSSVEECCCPYFEIIRRAARSIDAVWHDEGGPCWTFATTIPHETFTIFEDGEPFCEGIVFSMEHLRGETHG